jgi:hypothetical protein
MTPRIFIRGCSIYVRAARFWPGFRTLRRQWLGWKPVQIGMTADISRPRYFA